MKVLLQGLYVSSKEMSYLHVARWINVTTRHQKVYHFHQCNYPNFNNNITSLGIAMKQLRNSLSIEVTLAFAFINYFHLSTRPSSFLRTVFVEKRAFCFDGYGLCTSKTHWFRAFYCFLLLFLYCYFSGRIYWSFSRVKPCPRCQVLLCFPLKHWKQYLSSFCLRHLSSS